MAAERERFSTTTRLRALGEQAAARVYRAQHRRLGRPPRRSRLTGRAALLALVVCGLIVALAYPLREYAAQRADIAAQQREADAARERVEQLRDAKARWQDPAYVTQRAREHLQFVWPGEIGYVLPADEDAAGEAVDGDVDASDSEEETAAAREEREQREEREAAADRPWYDELWEGIDRAGGRR